MPRRRQRFSNLERQFRESGGVAAPNSRLAGYIDFKRGVNRITVSQVLTAEQRQRFGWGVIPFNLSVGATPAASDRYAAPITKYSNDAKATCGLTNAALGYQTIDAGTRQDDNFYPALLRVFVRSSNTPATPISAITKKEYRRYAGRQYSFPFGRTTTDVTDAKTGITDTTLDAVDEQDVRTSLTLRAKAAAGVKGVSYEPEVFKVGKPDLSSPGQ